MSDPRLARVSGVYPLADDDPRWKHGPRAVVTGALSAGACVLQLRLKHSSDRDALELARWAREQARAAGALLFVNDRYDLADLAQADGVHLGEGDLPPEQIPAELRERLLIGLSTHTLEQVRASLERPVDYIGFGPLFGTESKSSLYSARGLELLSQAVELAGRPVVAIGGIGLPNMADVARAGAAGAAVISAVTDAPDPAEATRALARAFDEGTR